MGSLVFPSISLIVLEALAKDGRDGDGGDSILSLFFPSPVMWAGCIFSSRLGLVRRPFLNCCSFQAPITASPFALSDLIVLAAPHSYQPCDIALSHASLKLACFVFVVCLFVCLQIVPLLNLLK
uniref:Uncharacterized protein n=1 Tax=Pipistrellus kuhlii TaxID=59472 RepID=A0A7J7XUV5_PIPKU|nr:hypothetical protein mPipKuh1_010437 [Pipistrellus kuhlii]